MEEGGGGDTNAGSQGDKKQTVQMRLRSLMNYYTVKAERRGESVLYMYVTIQVHTESYKLQPWKSHNLLTGGNYTRWCFF